ncbi:hypothetical protein F4604DRAFT_1675004 [Suillus subluteus]|nr:hypothetical protein F4604DRAFT_1675004 [Suillus subluteus]
MAVRRPKPRRREPSTSKVASLTQEECPSIPPPITITCEPWMNRAWRRPRQTRQLNLYLPALPPVLVLPGRQRLTQQNFCHPSSAPRTLVTQEDIDITNEVLFSDSLHFSNDPIGHRLTSSQKRANQWRRWSQDVIPSLLVPYLSYIQQTSALRYTNAPGQTQQDLGVCQAGCRTRNITVACVHFDVSQPNRVVRCGGNISRWNGIKVVMQASWPAITFLLSSPTFGGVRHISHSSISQLNTFVLVACFVLEEMFAMDQMLALFVAEKDVEHEKREKASTRFFTDTGLMALLCRHDRVLWLANLTSAGEKQHYALALLDQLFKHMPPQMTVGLLYDIGCQLERSCRKWQLLDDNTLSRISFAVVVFHAYGHQWPCQIIYHPRKREGFGLSDGEGCERLWSSLKQLIPSLRFSRFHQCFFVLDVQIHHLDTKSIQGYGHWLHRRWVHCQMKKNAALDSLLELDVDEDILRAQWKAQIAHQTRPIPRQSQNKAAEVITTILALEKTLDAHETSVRELEMQLYVGGVANVVEFNLQLADAQSQHAKIADTVRRRKAALGPQGQADLKMMKNDIYLTIRLNARAVKTRIRDRLRQRKFELERLERSYRATVNGTLLIFGLTDSCLCLSRRYEFEYTVKTVLKGYRIRRALASARALCPFPEYCPLFQSTKILRLEGQISIVTDPRWMYRLSDSILSLRVDKSGIRLQLEVDRCVEEETRVMRERSVMQEWMLAEWDAIQTALRDAANDLVMSFHLWAHAEELLSICVVWKKKAQEIPCAWPDDDDDESVGVEEESDEEGDMAYEVGDDELMDAIEEVALADEYRYQDEDLIDDIEDSFMPSSPTKPTPKKCRCI